MDISSVEAWLGVEFRNKDLLLHALQHRSYWNDNQGTTIRRSNERLEFLGDAVLELVVTEHLYLTYPDKEEGKMTEMRSKLVSAENLSRIGDTGNLFEHLMLSRGERKSSNVRGRQYLVACLIEAIIGALYLDQGIEVAKALVRRKILADAEQVMKVVSDMKSLLQEKAQEILKTTPTYQVLEETGPDHAKRFVVGVYLGGTLTAKGHGPSKKDAEVKAAEAALIIKGWTV